MNTMADGAAQRLVAQIGEIDLPELPPRDVVDTHLPTGVRIYGYTAEQMREYARAALAAQPSPAGQGDALVTDAMVAAALKRYLQLEPSEAENNPMDESTAQFMRQSLEAALAARQPVGQEPAAYIEHFADRVSRMEMTPHGLNLGIGKHAVYAGPPGGAK